MTKYDDGCNDLSWGCWRKRSKVNNDGGCPEKIFAISALEAQ